MLDLLLPPRCAACGSVLESATQAFCTVCRELFEPAEGGHCLRCRSPLEKGAFVCPACRAFGPLRDLRACFDFGGPLAEGIWHLKRRGTPQVADFLAAAMAESFRRAGWPKVALVPVPLHPKRFASRGFNQAALLARALARHLGLEVEGGLLKRAVWTKSQVSASTRAQRELAAAGAFHALKKGVSHPLCLVDDVVTTGATLLACAQALREQGARTVFALCVAQTPLGN